MKTLNYHDFTVVCGGVLTDKQAESLMAKAGGYAFKACFLGIIAATTTFVPVSAFLIGGIAAPVASLIGTYFFYENKDYFLQLADNTSSAFYPKA